MNSEKILFRHDQPHGPGEVAIAWQTGGSGALLATTGADGTVAVYNRKGQLHERIILNGICTGFGWDSDGDLLGIITANSLQVTVWNVHTAKKQILDLNLRDSPSCIVWAKKDPVLAIATSRGNLSLYNYSTTKRVSVIGKHSKRVTCGCWSNEGLLALAGDDRSLSVSSTDGDTLRVVPLRDIPHEVIFADMKTDERTPGENTISIILGKKTLFLYNLLDAENPIELGFQPKYGPLQIHKWFGDGYILLGFGAGHIVAISTHMQEVGQELFMVKSHKGLLDISLAPNTGEIASCGDNNVKIHSTTNLHETLAIISPVDDTLVYRVAWNTEGSLIAFTTARGSLQVHVVKLPPMGASCAPAVAVLSSIAEVTVHQHFGHKNLMEPFTIPLEIEPSVIALSQRYLAVAMNNRIWVYRMPVKDEDNPTFLGDRELMNNIKSLHINNTYLAIIHGGKLSLQMINPATEENADRESITFPENHIQDAEITCVDLTHKYFMVYGTDMGYVMLFSMNDWTMVREYRHEVGIKSIHSDPTGTWVLIHDDRGEGFVYSPANEKVVAIPDFPIGCKGVLWDQSFNTRHIFLVYTQTHIHLYVFIAQAVNGTRSEKVCTVPRNTDELPLMLSDGEITFLLSGGKISHFDIAGADIEMPKANLPEINNVIIDSHEFTEFTLERFIALRKFNEGWDVCLHLNNEDLWRTLGRAALENLNVDFAISVFRRLGDVSMVWALEEIAPIEELQLLCGHCATLLGMTDEACKYFLQSSQPQEALWLRRDLLQWQPALDLAKKVDVTQFPFIAREYATQLEFTGKYDEALKYFTEGMIDDNSHGDYVASNRSYNGIQNINEHNCLCQNGVARCSIRCGEVKKGIILATASGNKDLARECADILLELKQLGDAAEMYERAEYWDQSAAIYIQLSAWNKVGNMLDKVTSAKIHLQYAQAKEKAALYEDAVHAYATAKDYNSVIRIQLEHLNNPHAAVELLEQNPSTEGAKMVARFYQRISDHESAMKFLVLSGCNTEAYELAKRHGLLQELGTLLVAGTGSTTDFKLLAEHFEAQASSLLAGKYYFHAREFPKALKHLLKASAVSSAENEAISLAVDTVASANDEKLVSHLIEFLLGEADGVPKDPKYLFRLYMARKQFKESAKAAIIIANQEQINGNYKNAHNVLFSMYQELHHNGLPVANDMRNSLNLLHSYILVRVHVKRNDHDRAARLLLRVASNISKFPQHMVPILTSTVIECHRAGLKQSAFTYAARLMQQDYRNQVDPKYIKKIETIVRKTRSGKDSDNGKDENELKSPCPYCNVPISDMDLVCDECKMCIPFCIATGRHIIKEDLTACPECDFPAIRSEFVRILESETQCPMCNENVTAHRLNRVQDPSQYLNINN